MNPKSSTNPAPKCAECPALKRSAFAELGPKDFALVDGAKKFLDFSRGKELPFLDLKQTGRTGFYCIQKGHIKLNVVDGSSKESTIRICGPGDLVGYGNLFPQSNTPHTAQALENASACYFEKDSFLRVQNYSPSIARGIIKMLCKIINIKDKRIAGLENHTVKGRVAALLLSLDEKFGVPSKFGSKIDLTIDRKTLATLAGTVVETFARILSDLEREELILREGRTIHIRSAKHLRRM